MRLLGAETRSILINPCTEIRICMMSYSVKDGAIRQIRPFHWFKSLKQGGRTINNSILVKVQGGYSMEYKSTVQPILH